MEQLNGRLDRFRKRFAQEGERIITCGDELGRDFFILESGAVEVVDEVDVRPASRRELHE